MTLDPAMTAVTPDVFKASFSVTATWLQPKAATTGAIQRMSKDDDVMGYCVAGTGALAMKAGGAAVKLTGAAALVAGAVTGLAAALF